MTSQGSPYARFRRALKTRNLNLIRAAAAELPRIELNDALEVCLIVRDRQPDRFDAAQSAGSLVTAPSALISTSRSSTPQ